MPVLESLRYLILVKHSLPQVDPRVDAHHWHLSEEGKQRSQQLAHELDRYHPARLVSSPEPKALETAQILAEALHLPLETVEGLHEHLRSRVGYQEHQAFEEAVRSLFSQPDEPVFGDESAHQALKRFRLALETSQQRYPIDNLMAVTHGTVISLYLQATCGLEPFETWRSLGMPSYAVLGLPQYQLLHLVTDPV